MPGSDVGDSAPRSLREHGLGARKRLGQHFLVGHSFLQRILSAAALSGKDEVLEVGAGTGVLTHALVEEAARVVSVELDDALYQLLSNKFEECRNVTIWHGNALDFDPCSHFSDGYKLVGNIPYYITGALIRHYLENPCQPVLLVLMVQREVAERMAAAPGRLSILGVSVQFYAKVEIVARVPRGAFYPRPKVESAIVKLLPHGLPCDDALRQSFFTLLRAGFSARRKQLSNSLANGLSVMPGDVRQLLDGTGVEGIRRAETLTIDEWKILARKWLEMSSSITR